MELGHRVGKHLLKQQDWLTRIEAVGELTLIDAQEFCKIYDDILTKQPAVFVAMIVKGSPGASREARHYMVEWQRQKPDTRRLFVALVMPSLLARTAVSLIMSAMAAFSKDSSENKSFPDEDLAVAWLDMKRHARGRK